MRNVFKVAPVLALIFMLSACGGGGGTPDPDPIAKGVVDAITGESFSKIWGYYPGHVHDIGKGQTEAKTWRMKEGWERWKDLKPRFEGDNGLDPKDKSGITGGEEKWVGASDAERHAVFLGLYRIYTADDWEKRLKEGGWYMASRNVKLDVEGQGTAEFRFRNRYNDSIEVGCTRENGLWYLAGVEVNIDKKMPEKPKD